MSYFDEKQSKIIMEDEDKEIQSEIHSSYDSGEPIFLKNFRNLITKI